MNTRPPKMIRPQFFEITTHCVQCGKLVPPERLKYKAITCTEEHARLRKLSMRTRQDSRECRFCRKPTTPAEKASYQRFRKWEAANPDLAYPAQFKRWSTAEYPLYEGGKGKTFTLAIAQHMAEEDENAAERAKTGRAAAASGTPETPPEMEPICAPGL